MTTLAQVLEFMFPGKQGVQVRIKNGIEEIHKWPGPEPLPNAAQIAAGRTAYEAQKEDHGAGRDIERDRLSRLLFEVDYEHESRLRVLEGKPAITKAQYKDALVALYKSIR